MIHEFEIGLNEKVVIDENWQAYNYFRKIFKALLDETDLGMTEILQEENLNKISLETFLDRLQSFTGSTFDSCSDLIVRILFAAGIEDYSKERFFNEYYYKYINWDSYLEPIYDAVAAIHENEAVLNEIRENEARLKSRWMGGGFGIKGAIIGSLEAELLSLCESSFRQIFVTPIKKNLDKLTIENSKRELLHSKEFKELVYDAVHNSILGFFVALIDLLIRNNIIHPLNFSDVMIQHDESVRNRFENTLNFTDIKEERGGVQKLCIECIQASPYNIIYYFTLKLYDPYNTNIDSLMETLGIYEEYKKHTHILFAERIKELPSPYLIGTKEHLMKAFDQAFELADEGVDISDLIVPYISKINNVIKTNEDAEDFELYISKAIGSKNKDLTEQILYVIKKASPDAGNIKQISSKWKYNLAEQFEEIVELARNGNVDAKENIIDFFISKKNLFYIQKLEGKRTLETDENYFLQKNYEFECPTIVNYTYELALPEYFPDYKTNGFDLLMLALITQAQESYILYDIEYIYSEKVLEISTVVNLLEASYHMGCVPAAYYLGLYYYSEKDDFNGKKYMLIAADNSYGPAKDFVKKAYTNGNYGFEQDSLKASLFSVFSYYPQGKLNRETLIKNMCAVLYNIYIREMKSNMREGIILYKSYFNLCRRLMIEACDLLNQYEEKKFEILDTQDIISPNEEILLYIIARSKHSVNIKITDKEFCYIDRSNKNAQSWVRIPLSKMDFSSFEHDDNKISFKTKTSAETYKFRASDDFYGEWKYFMEVMRRVGKELDNGILKSMIR